MYGMTEENEILSMRRRSTYVWWAARILKTFLEEEGDGLDEDAVRVMGEVADELLREGEELSSAASRLKAAAHIRLLAEERFPEGGREQKALLDGVAAMEAGVQAIRSKYFGNEDPPPPAEN